ncbi:MAG TPA: DUF4325 domain-containing protein [bacterium]|nr:DUF4325 domain-containing protein [bacterium]
MTKVRARGEEIRRFILENVVNHPHEIGAKTAERFGISRQAVNRHLQKLVDENCLTAAGNTRSRSYQLAVVVEWEKSYEINANLAEDIVWRNDVKPTLGQLPDNVMAIWQFGFTEMFNNVIDHSNGTTVTISIKKSAVSTEMNIFDNGIGIFRKIAGELNLIDESHAVLELAKGKLTTDPAHHTGEGIFFTSRMFDEFTIFSGATYFTHSFGKEEDWILASKKVFEQGTYIWLRLANHTARTAKQIFDQYTSGDDLGFNKTTVPVFLVEYGRDMLISRSQAKRLLARIDLFKTVVFDFKGVDMIGQAFADEIFRVFANEHPQIKLDWINTNDEIEKMIRRIKTNVK